MLYIESLEFEDYILEKIESKHSITFSEVEEACLSDKRHVRKSKEGLDKKEIAAKLGITEERVSHRLERL